MSSELVELVEKYRRMRALREQRARAIDDGRSHEPPRDELRELSRKWPGALAEIDRLAPEVLDERLATLEAIARGERADVPAWALGWVLAHRRLRGALAIKAWLRGLRRIDEKTREAFERASLPEESALYRERLSEIASPPGGRLVDVVFGDVARALGIRRERVRELLMPRP